MPLSSLRDSSRRNRIHSFSARTNRSSRGRFEILESRCMLAALTPHYTLSNPTPAGNDRFGFSTAISEDFLFVTTHRDDADSTDSGLIDVYSAHTGQHLRTIHNPTPASGDIFGFSVSASGNLVAVGAYRDDAGASNSGAIHIFDASTGALVRTIVNPSPGVEDDFGVSVAIAGDLVVVGALNDDSDATDTGIAYIFNADTGALVQTLHNPTPGTGDAFGRSVALQGGNAVIGAYSDDAGAVDAGAVYVFNASTGALIHSLNNPTPAIADEFGNSVAVDGNFVVVGDDETASNSAGAFLFDLTTGNLVRTIHSPSEIAGDRFGSSVSISNGLVVIGAHGPNSPSGGDAYIFDAETGTLIHSIQNPTPNLGDDFGSSVCILGNRVVVGAYKDERPFEPTDTGRAYIFAIPPKPLQVEIDSIFGTMGQVITSISAGHDAAWSLAIQDDGKIVAAGGANGDFAIVRYNANGALDSTFSDDGKVTIDFEGGDDIAVGIIIETGGKLVVSGVADNGTDADFALVRLTSEGLLDATFGVGGRVLTAFGPTSNDAGNCMAVQADGKIVVAGETRDGVTSQIAMARYDQDGSLDSTFGINGRITTAVGDVAAVYSVDVLENGKIVAGGPGITEVGNSVLLRYDANGLLDTSFSGDGIVSIEGRGLVHNLATLADESTLVLSDRITKITSDGSLDESFGSHGQVIIENSTIGDPWAISVSSNGSILVAGVGDPSAAYGLSLAQFTEGGILDYSFGYGGVITTQVSSFSGAFSMAVSNSGTRPTVLIGGFTRASGNADFAIVRHVLVDSPDSLRQLDLNGEIYGSMTESSHPQNLTIAGNRLYFTIGNELWTSDGIDGGATRVREFVKAIRELVAVDDAIYFFLAGSTPELWKSDGTAVGTSQVISLPQVNSVDELFAFHDCVVFAANDSEHGRELWISDGTSEGTKLLKDIYNGGDSNPTPIASIGNILYFSATTSSYTNALWRTDGTESGTVLVKGVNVLNSNASIAEVNGVLFFVADDLAGGYALWRSDGSSVGTSIVKGGLLKNSESSGISVVSFGGLVYFAADDGQSGFELWKSDGTTSGTNLVKDILSGSGSSYPYYLTVAGSHLYFTAIDDAHGDQVWTTDGTNGGTVRVTNVSTDRNSGNVYISNLAVVNDRLFFWVSLATTGIELWQSNGTAVGTSMVKDINSGPADSIVSASYPNPIAALENRLFFTADDGIHGEELWVLDVSRPGDYDADGDVDGSDFLYWQRSYGTTVEIAGSSADGEGNGRVDVGDLAVWHNHFGQSEPALESLGLWAETKRSSVARTSDVIDAIFASGDFASQYADNGTGDFVTNRWARRRLRHQGSVVDALLRVTA